MNTLRWFLSWSYKNANDRRELRRNALRNRLYNVWTIDNERERGHCFTTQYLKYGPFWYQCQVSPEPLCWVGRENQAELASLLGK